MSKGILGGNHLNGDFLYAGGLADSWQMGRIDQKGHLNSLEAVPGRPRCEARRKMLREIAQVPTGPPKLEVLDLLGKSLRPSRFGNQDLPNLKADENEFF